MKKELINNVEYSINYFDKEFKRNERKNFHHVNKIYNVKQLLGKVKKGEKILDLGTCSGTFAFITAKDGAESYATDISEQAIKYCKKRKEKENINNIFFKKASAEQQPFNSAFFDKVIMGDIAEHLPYEIFKKTIKECFRILKSNGKLIIYTPNKTHIFELLKKNNIILKKDKTHINLMGMKEINEILKNNNFTIEKAYFKSSHIPIFNFIEKILSYIPFLGIYFKRRICILAKK